MNWDALGAIAETFGAIAVVASLVYLGRQVKHGSREVRANTSNSVISAVQDGFMPRGAVRPVRWAAWRFRGAARWTHCRSRMCPMEMTGTAL
jgi:hypothetical protein